MTSSDLLKTKVTLMISDPWDFGTECGVGPFNGEFADLDRDRMLVRLERPIKYSNRIFKSALCHVRHEGISTDNLRERTRVSVNITLLSEDFTSLNKVDQAVFKEGFGAIGTIELS
jgi:hypothetical protein